MLPNEARTLSAHIKNKLGIVVWARSDLQYRIDGEDFRDQRRCYLRDVVHGDVLHVQDHNVAIHAVLH